MTLGKLMGEAPRMLTMGAENGAPEDEVQAEMQQVYKADEE
jgi:hypothetical protein